MKNGLFKDRFAALILICTMLFSGCGESQLNYVQCILDQPFEGDIVVYNQAGSQNPQKLLSGSYRMNLSATARNTYDFRRWPNSNVRFSAKFANGESIITTAGHGGYQLTIETWDGESNMTLRMRKL